MSYKTLILIDNSSSLTTLNQEIIKETVKYYISNCSGDDKVAIAVTGEIAEYLTDYDDSLTTQLKTIESLKFSDVTAPGADVIMEVLFDWEKGDFANRDIIYISCKSVNNMNSYTEEELLFEVNNRQYPIYCISCVQDGNEAAIKSMNMLSRLSGGVSVRTDEASKDAEVEKQLCDLLRKSIDEKRALEEGIDENKTETISDATSDREIDNNDIESESYTDDYDMGQSYSQPGDELDGTNNVTGNSDMTENLSEEGQNSTIIYENSELGSENKSPDIMYYLILMAAVVSFVTLILKIFRNKKIHREDASSKKKTSNSECKRPREGREYEPFAAAREITNSIQGEVNTVKLGNKEKEDLDTGTRILYRAKDGIEITLEDRSDPTKFYRACVNDSIIIGRNEKMCDIAIEYDDSISSTHCELYSRDNVLYIRDLDSSNGTVVNQHKVYQEIALESGDILRIGRLTFFIQIVRDNSYE